MDFIKQHKNIAIGIAILLVGFVLYSVFFAGGGDTDTLVSERAPDRIPEEGNLIELLEQLRRVSLDDAVFATPVFQSLVDFSIDIGNASSRTGRDNPFEPLSIFASLSTPSEDIAPPDLAESEDDLGPPADI